MPTKQLKFVYPTQSQAESDFLRGFFRAGWYEDSFNDNGLTVCFRSERFPFVTMYSQFNLEPGFNVSHVVDFFLMFPDGGVVINVDGYWYHRSKKAFAQDRHIDWEIQARGLKVFRIPATHVLNEHDCDLTVSKVHSYIGGRLRSWQERARCSKLNTHNFGEASWSARCDDVTPPVRALLPAPRPRPT